MYDAPTLSLVRDEAAEPPSAVITFFTTFLSVVLFFTYRHFPPSQNCTSMFTSVLLNFWKRLVIA